MYAYFLIYENVSDKVVDIKLIAKKKRSDIERLLISFLLHTGVLQCYFVCVNIKVRNNVLTYKI